MSVSGTAPVADGGPRAPRASARARFLVVGAALALAAPLVVAAGSLVWRAAGPAPAAPATRSLFPAGTQARVAALRDRLVAGLLVLRRPEGDFSPRDDGAEVDPMDRAEATAMGVAGLAAARRMGARVAGLDDALAATKASLTRRQTRGGMFGVSRQQRRGVAVSALAGSVLALAYADDRADDSALDLAGRTLVSQTTIGTLPAGWVQGVAARAVAALASTGRRALLVPDPVTAVPSKPIELGRRCTDSHVAQAVAEAIQAELGASRTPFAAAVLERQLAEPPTWTGETTDVGSLVLAAWLAARVDGGARWFERVLPVLEQAVGADGTIRGTYYGDPVSRTAGALLVLAEGAGVLVGGADATRSR